MLTKPLGGWVLDLTIFFFKASLKRWIGNIIEYQRVSKENLAIFGHFWPFFGHFQAQKWQKLELNGVKLFFGHFFSKASLKCWVGNIFEY